MKRFLSLAIALMMVLSMVPAMAEGVEYIAAPYTLAEGENIFDIYLHQAGQYFLHFWDTSLQLWAFGTYRRIYITYPITLCCNQANCLGQQYLTIDVLEFSCIVRKMITDIAHIGGSQQSITNSMNQHIGI